MRHLVKRKMNQLDVHEVKSVMLHLFDAFVPPLVHTSADTRILMSYPHFPLINCDLLLSLSLASMSKPMHFVSIISRMLNGSRNAVSCLALSGLFLSCVSVSLCQRNN